MSEKIFAVVLCALLLALSFPVHAQQSKKVPQVGYVGAGSPATAGHQVKAFLQGLRELAHH